MSDIIKRGRLDVKKRNIFGSAYKNRWVLLRNSTALNCKTVEIMEGEDEMEDTRDIICLNDAWSVQDKPSKSRVRYTFELIKGEDVVLTFACTTLLERDEWMESLRILKQLAVLCHVDNQPSPPLSNYFAVTLAKNRSAVEINHSGSYLLSITDSAIVLHWRTGAIAHHWPKRSVIKLFHHPKREGRLMLQAKSSNCDGVMEFEFTSTKENSIQILKTWNVRLLESIPYNPQQINEMSSASNEIKKKKGRSMSSKSFRTLKMPFANHNSELIRRAESLSKLHKYRTDVGVHATRSSFTPSTRTYQGGLRIGGLPPLPHEAKVRSWIGPDDQWGPGGGSLSQDSVTRCVIRGSSPPPPLPPRPSERIRGSSSYADIEDPDYAYIKEDEIKGPNNSSSIRRTQSNSSVDDVLNELERDIIRENQAKKIEEDRKRRAMTLGRARAHLQEKSQRPLKLGPAVEFTMTEPQDYTDFVPSTSRQGKSSSSEPEGPIKRVTHIRSASEPDPQPFEFPSNTLSQPPLLKDPMLSVGLTASESHTPLSQQIISKSVSTGPPSSFNCPSNVSFSTNAPNSEQTMFSKDGTVPSLPPRTWRNTSFSNLEGDLVTESPTSASPTSPAVGGRNMMRNGGGAEGCNIQLAEKLKIHGQGEETFSHSLTSIGDTYTNRSASSVTTPSPTSTASPTLTTPTFSTLELTTPPPIPPPIPPRSPTKDHLSRQSSSSSTSSTSSSTRCHHCRGSRNKPKAVVEKTVSLGPAPGTRQFPDDCRKSMPNLLGAIKSMPENGLGTGRHRYGSRHSSRCSQADSSNDIHGGMENTNSLSQHSSTATRCEYLQLVGEEHTSTSTMERDLDSMDLVSSCLKGFDYLDKNRLTSSSGMGTEESGSAELTTNTSSGTTSSSPSTFSSSASTTVKVGVGSKVIFQSASSSRVAPHLESELTRAQRETELTPAGFSQPLLQTCHGVSGIGGTGLQPVYSNSSQTHDTKNALIINEPTSHHKASPSSMVGKAKRGQQANGTPPQCSSSIVGLTTPSSPPTVPPRSVVSLMQQRPLTTSASKQQHLLNTMLSQPNSSSSRLPVYDRKFTSQVNHSSSSTAIGPSTTALARHASLARRQADHMDSQGQSSTVFIHHLKDRRVDGLTHLV